MAKSYKLTEGQISRLKDKVLRGAQNYKKYLEGKSFLIVCVDGLRVTVRFFQIDFKHLTGIESDLDDQSFYNNCIDNNISTGNIFTLQKYNWSTLKSKSDRIENLYELLLKIQISHCF